MAHDSHLALLIDHIDNNPFGVNAQVRKVITDSLTHMIKSIA